MFNFSLFGEPQDITLKIFKLFSAQELNVLSGVSRGCEQFSNRRLRRYFSKSAISIPAGRRPKNYATIYFNASGCPAPGTPVMRCAAQTT